MVKLVPNTERLDVARALESIRLEKGLTKLAFSKMAKISSSFYSEIINNKKSLNLQTLEKICININVPIDIFIFKALNENSIEDIEKRKLVREIRPLMNEIVKLLYQEDLSNQLDR